MGDIDDENFIFVGKFLRGWIRIGFRKPIPGMSFPKFSDE